MSRTHDDLFAGARWEIAELAKVRLQARTYALQAAVITRGKFGEESVLKAAEQYEAWLTRPRPERQV